MFHYWIIFKRNIRFSSCDCILYCFKLRGNPTHTLHFLGMKIIDGAFFVSYVMIAEYLHSECSMFLLTVGVLKVNRFIWMYFDWKQNDRSSESPNQIGRRCMLGFCNSSMDWTVARSGRRFEMDCTLCRTVVLRWTPFVVFLWCGSSVIGLEFCKLISCLVPGIFFFFK